LIARALPFRREASSGMFSVRSPNWWYQRMDSFHSPYYLVVIQRRSSPRFYRNSASLTLGRSLTTRRQVLWTRLHFPYSKEWPPMIPTQGSVIRSYRTASLADRARICCSVLASRSRLPGRSYPLSFPALMAHQFIPETGCRGPYCYSSWVAWDLLLPLRHVC
jgi:hypothetical protein